MEVKLVKLKIGQCPKTHVDPAEVGRAINVGGRSRLIGMALSVEHRPTVEAYLDDAVWQAYHATGLDKKQWIRISGHIEFVLGATKEHHDQAARSVEGGA